MNEKQIDLLLKIGLDFDYLKPLSDEQIIEIEENKKSPSIDELFLFVFFFWIEMFYMKYIHKIIIF